VDVARGANEAVFHFEQSLRAHHISARRAFDVPGHADREVDAELDGIRDGEFDLGEVSARTENAEVRDDAFARPDERDGLLGGELSFLVKPLWTVNSAPLSEKQFQVFG